MPVPTRMQSPVPRVLCAMCGTVVEKLTWWEESSSQKLVIVAHCHGATDKMELTLQQRMEIGDLLQGQEGRAFTTRRLDNV